MSGLRVLLIGDEEAESRHIFTVLSEADHAVLPVPSFDEASEALLIQKFDVVLIAHSFLGERVAGFTAQLREAEKRQRHGARTPVLSVSPKDPERGSTPSGGDGRVDAYLPQHFEPAAFAQTVENLANAVAQRNEEAEGDSAPAELPVFNVAEFKAQVAYDTDLMVEIIDLFLAERVHDVTEMSEALAARDFGQLMRAAHTIKGSLGSLHADLARHHAQELETAAKSEREQSCIGFLGALEQDLNDLEPKLLSLRDSPHSY